MQELLGRENVESVQSIADFGGRFTTGSLCGKLLASCLDLPNGTLPQNAIGVLKTFCGDDSVKGEVKYKQSFTYYRKPLLMMAGNHSITLKPAAFRDKSPTSNLSAQVIRQEQPLSERAALNPDWVEWLMGFPPKWTDASFGVPSPKESPA